MVQSSRRIAHAVTTAAMAFGIACGSSSGGSSGGITRCGDYFDARLLNPCGTGPALPADELSRLRGRFEQVCQASLALPGSQLTEAQLESCAQAIQTAGCKGAAAQPQECIFFGALAAGAECNEGFQCQSGLCFQSASVGDGGTAPMSSLCGKCEPVVAVGQSCATGTCEQGSICDSTSASPKCVHMTSGSVGARCNGATTICDPGLFCDVSTMTCTVTFPDGEACTSSTECTAPATCRAKKCQGPSQDGGGCYVDTDCAAGLGCSMSQTCGAVVWGSAGQPCGDLQRCLVGDCGPTGTCPVVVADGQTCPADATSTCDSLADCASGSCALEDTSVCR